MATSQHEGHANQLDLLIRAGNVFHPRLWCRCGTLGRRAGQVFPRNRCAWPRVVALWSNGGQSGSDHLGSGLHGAATRFIPPALRGDYGSLIAAGGLLSAPRVPCTFVPDFPLRSGAGITAWSSALHNQEVRGCCLSYVFATLSGEEGHVGLFLLASVCATRRPRLAGGS